MEETIYTIPINESFEEKDGCPFCRLRRKLEDTERDLIMGASMMEPDIRIKTNELGFCRKHYDKMFAQNNRLSLALMLESHLKEKKDKVSVCKKGLLGKTANDKVSRNIRELSSSCYICTRVEEKFTKMMFNAVYLWQKQTEFRRLFSEQPYFCLPHTEMYLEAAKLKMDKRIYGDFVKAFDDVQNKYTHSLIEDVSWFCKKFDYRYQDEPWGTAKDAVERAIAFLEGDF